MPEALAYLNGQFIPASEMSIGIGDAGFVYGATATEFVRTFRGRLFRLGDHLARLEQSCNLARIPLCERADELRTVAETLAGHNYTGHELALIAFATPGPLPHLSGSPGRPTLGMHTVPLPFARYRGLYAGGARLVVPAMRQQAAFDPRCKVRSRLHWWIAERQARELDADAWPLLLDRDGFVTETAAANFLIVRDGAVLSPPRTDILNGISLLVTEELCRELGIAFAERRLTLADCQSADEAMLTGTAFCLAGVRSIEAVDLPWPGPVTRRLLTAWNERAGVEIAGQCLSGGSI